MRMGRVMESTLRQHLVSTPEFPQDGLENEVEALGVALGRVLAEPMRLRQMRIPLVVGVDVIVESARERGDRGTDDDVLDRGADHRREAGRPAGAGEAAMDGIGRLEGDGPDAGA